MLGQSNYSEAEAILLANLAALRESKAGHDL
jgi:hypothetical protein